VRILRGYWGVFLLGRAAKGYFILTFGDFNAVIGLERMPNDRVLGLRVVNDNSERLLDPCRSLGLRIAGTWLRRKDIGLHYMDLIF